MDIRLSHYILESRVDDKMLKLMTEAADLADAFYLNGSRMVSNDEEATDHRLQPFDEDASLIRFNFVYTGNDSISEMMYASARLGLAIANAEREWDEFLKLPQP